MYDHGLYGEGEVTCYFPERRRSSGDLAGVQFEHG